MSLQVPANRGHGLWCGRTDLHQPVCPELRVSQNKKSKQEQSYRKHFHHQKHLVFSVYNEIKGIQNLLHYFFVSVFSVDFKNLEDLP